ncbi:hypothetical protein T492DRAFT_468904 [Pavlovales sp. CCMP2436]|nr:hypothetical protein T492DRAFT_468904 [Pavlovales sp. CCMP2436]
MRGEAPGLPRPPAPTWRVAALTVLAMARGASAQTGSVWAATPIGRWPMPPASVRELEAELLAQIRQGKFPLQKDPAPRPPWVPLDFGALDARNCTSCFEQQYRRSLRAAPFAPRVGEATVLWDDFAIDAHACVARSAELPRKRLLSELRPDPPPVAASPGGNAKHPFGFFGTVLPLPPQATAETLRSQGRARSRFRMWLGEREAWVADSEDGVHWAAPAPLAKAWPTHGEFRHTELFPNMCVTVDPHGSFSERGRGSGIGASGGGERGDGARGDKAGAGAFGEHAIPKEQSQVTGRLLLTHPCGNGRMGHSICLAQSAIGDGLRWRPLRGNRLTGKPGDLPQSFANSCGPMCALGADSNNCVRWDEYFEEYRLVKRHHWPLPPERWRGVRGVQIGRATSLDRGVNTRGNNGGRSDGGGSDRGFEELGAWKLDRGCPLSQCQHVHWL